MMMFMASCGQAPKCSSEEAKETVLDISRNELKKQMNSAYGNDNMADKLKLALDAIREKEVNKETGARHCSAELVMEGSGKSQRLPIDYTLENTEDGNFYASVYGLQ